MNRWVAFFAVLLGASLYGLMAPVIKMAYSAGLTETEVIAGQYACALLICILSLPVFYRQLRRLGMREFWLLFFVGSVGLGGTSVFYYLALHALPASLAVVLLFQFVWIVLVMDLVRHRRLPRPYELVALAFVIGGTIFSVQMTGVRLEDLPWTGWLYGAIAAVTYAVFLYFNADLPRSLSSWGKSAVMTIVASMLIFAMFPPQFLWSGRWLDILPWMLILGVFCSIIPTLLFAFGTPHIHAALVGILGSVELPVSVIAAALLLAEPVNGMQWLGICLILFGIVIVEWRSQRSRKNNA